MKRIAIEKVVNKIGERVVVSGWVNSVRDHKKVVFIDLRDRSGMVQIVGGEELAKYSNEDVITVEGNVCKRDDKFINPKIKTGEIEVRAEKITLLAKAKPLPFSVISDGRDLNEELRLKYRYLDLRRPRMRDNLYTRHRLLQLFRQYLTKEGFWEVETPNLSKSTPEGARDFLVPSRLHRGKFYALPQSPQQYKQLLMVAGIEKYFQIATCFRDEDMRSDRLYEFKQVDIEMSFVTRDDVLNLVERVVVKVAEAMGKKIMKRPFPRISYEEAMAKYGQDKFDLRQNKKDDVLAFAWVIDFPLFERLETRALNPMHHPFTAPNPEDIKMLDKDPTKVRSWQYDLVCNGHEVAGGSIRITDPKVQAKIFQILGHKDKEIQERFGHLLEAFEYGVPPHGGIALGFERFVMLFTGEENLREVNAFPPTISGKTAVMEAPSEVEPEQLRELGIKLCHDPEKKKKK